MLASVLQAASQRFRRFLALQRSNFSPGRSSVCGKAAVSGSLRATRRATTARYSSTAGRDKSARRSTPRRLPGLCAARARRPPARARRGRPVINNTLLDLFVSGIASMASRPTPSARRLHARAAAAARVRPAARARRRSRGGPCRGTGRRRRRVLWSASARGGARRARASRGCTTRK